jgi:hypothetical protein
LQALQFAQSLVEASLYRGLVAGSLEKALAPLASRIKLRPSIDVPSGIGRKYPAAESAAERASLLSQSNTPASTRRVRRNLHWVATICSTSRSSISPSGRSSALRRSSNSLRASSSSSGSRTSYASRPCFRASCRTLALPSGVLGPVLLRAFCRLT